MSKHKNCPFCGGEVTPGDKDGDGDFDHFIVEHASWECFLAGLTGEVYQVIHENDISDWDERG